MTDQELQEAAHRLAKCGAMRFRRWVTEGPPTETESLGRAESAGLVDVQRHRVRTKEPLIPAVVRRRIERERASNPFAALIAPVWKRPLSAYSGKLRDCYYENGAFWCYSGLIGKWQQVRARPDGWDAEWFPRDPMFPLECLRRAKLTSEGNPSNAVPNVPTVRYNAETDVSVFATDRPGGLLLRNWASESGALWVRQAPMFIFLDDDAVIRRLCAAPNPPQPNHLPLWHTIDFVPTTSILEVPSPVVRSRLEASGSGGQES